MNNPLQLLMKGRALRGSKDGAGTYKLPTRNLLPNFGGKKNAISSHRTDLIAQEQERDERGEKSERDPQQSIELFAGQKGGQKSPGPERAALQTAKLSPFQAQNSPAGLPPGPAGARKKFDFTGWLMNLAGRIMKRKPATPRKTVQTELRLDQVTVMRNDLSDDDVEVVSVDTKPATHKKGLKVASVQETEKKEAKVEDAVTNS